VAPAIFVMGPFFLKWLAEESIFFTTVKEGTVKTIMRGKSFERFVMSFEGYHLNDPRKLLWYNVNFPDWEVLHHGKGNSNGLTGKMMLDSYYDDRGWLLKHLGLYWVGLPWANEVYVYAFEWNETVTDSKGKETVLFRAEATDFIFVSDFTYAIVTEGAETKDLLPTDELTLVTLAICNPYRALFSGEDWMRRITAAINRHVRNFVGQEDFQDLVSNKIATGFSKPIIELNEELADDVAGKSPTGLKGKYGVEIRTADLQTIELSGDGKTRGQEATLREYLANQEAKAIKIEGEAKASVVETMGRAEAEALKARLAIIEKSSSGELLAQLDAMQKASKGEGNTVIWANDPFVAVGAKILTPDTKKGVRE
jgi:hypothetical protein